MTHRTTGFFAAVSLAVVASAFSGGCKGKDGPHLPPATGSAAPPLASVPTLPKAEAGNEAPAAARVGTGSLRPRHEAELGPKASGVISHIAVEEGDRVKKGQLLFRLEGTQAALAVEQAKAVLASADVQLGAAKLDYDRTKSLIERGAIAQATYDQAKSRYDAAATAVEQAKAALGMARRMAHDTAIVSPIDGVVTSRRMNVGETATMMPPTVVLVVEDVESLELRARLPERALRYVREGSTITARFTAVDEERDVVVKRITPTIDPKTRTIEIVADVDNHDRKLKAGMLAEVEYGTLATKDDSGEEPATPPKNGQKPSGTRPAGVRRSP